MKKILIFLGVLSIFFPLSSYADSANISKLVFTTEDLKVNPGEISGAIVVQVQNSSGEAEQVSETNDVTFTSSSPTGKFLNATGGDVSKTMSKNTASRTFYYQDSTAGDHTLTVEIKGRETGTTFSASATIKVGEGGANTTDEEDSDEEPGDEDESKNSSSGTHSSQTSLSTYKAKKKILADAGRERKVLINTPVSFFAELSSGASLNKKNYKWSFGDGSSDTGLKVSHSYMFPGEYNVVLNIDSEDGNVAIARTKVTVLDPKISFSYGTLNGKSYVEVKNESSDEVNIGDWNIDGGKYSLFVADDTIVKGKGSVKIPFAPVSPKDSISFTYPNGEIYDTKIANEDFLNNEKKAQILSLEKEIAQLREELEKIKVIEIATTPKIEAFPSTTTQKQIDLNVSGGENDKEPRVSEKENAKALLLESLENEKKFKIPGFEFIKKVFSPNE